MSIESLNAQELSQLCEKADLERLQELVENYRKMPTAKREIVSKRFYETPSSGLSAFHWACIHVRTNIRNNYICNIVTS